MFGGIMDMFGKLPPAALELIGNPGKMKEEVNAFIGASNELILAVEAILKPVTDIGDALDIVQAEYDRLDKALAAYKVQTAKIKALMP